MPIKTPRVDQVADLSFFINNPKAGLLHDPGVGKTITAAVYTEYCWRYKQWKTVWTQPKGIMKKNRREILEATDLKPEEVIMIQGDRATRDRRRADPRGKVFLMTANCWSDEHDELLKHHPDVKCSIHDEIQLYYITHKAQRTQNWYAASRHMKSVIPMSGTIIRGRLDSVYPTLHVIAPHFYGSYESFMAQHALYDEYGKVCGWQNHEKLRNVLGAVSIRRSFESVYGNQDPLIQFVPCDMSKNQEKVYRQWEEMGLLELEDRFLEATGKGVAALRCRQILCHPERVRLPIAFNDEGKATDFKDFDLVGKHHVTGKDEALLTEAEILHAAGERLAVFCSLVPEQERVVMLLKEKGYRVAMINGTISGPQRQKIDEDFQDGKYDIVVGTPDTCGIGFNWHFLKTIIFTSLTYGDDAFIQAYRRGIRGKRETPLRVLVLEYENSIDQAIFGIVQRKMKDYQQVDETKQDVFASAMRKVQKTEAKEAIKAATKAVKSKHTGGPFSMGNI